jgi:Zn-dependent peptidase ImmA (M78 family)
MTSSRPRGVVEAELVRHTRGLGNDHLDVVRLAEEMGIDLVGLSWPDNPIEGKYVRRHGRPFILVNTVHPFTRQRFTIGHELGHHCLTEGQDDVEYIDDSSSMRSQTNDERQANLFASALLMDEHGVRGVTGGLDWQADVAAVVRTFEVSLEAAAIRLRELDLLDDPTVSAFMKDLKQPGRRSEFMVLHDLRSRDDHWRYEQHLPARFTRRARRLHEAGILSNARAAEILERPRHSAEA